MAFKWRFSDMYILAEVLQNFTSAQATSTLKLIQAHATSNQKIQTAFSLKKFNHMVYFDPIIHYSAGNDQFTFVSLLQGLLCLLRQNRFSEK